jgi:hypothetical protein
MRASFETDLMKGHPFYFVCKWSGNSQAVAIRHDLQVIDDDFGAVLSRAEPDTQAAQIAAQSGTDLSDPQATKNPNPNPGSGLGCR